MARQNRKSCIPSCTNLLTKMIMRTVPADSGEPYGNVIVKSGTRLSIKNSTEGVTITKGFECEKGAEIVIQ